MAGRSSSLVLLLLAGCSTRYCGACVGWSHRLEPDELDPLELEVTERWVRGATPSPASDRFEAVVIFLELRSPPDATCPSLPATTAVALNGVALATKHLGGGALHLPAAGQTPEQCEPFSAELTSTELLGGRVLGPDVLRIGTTTVEFFAGRPEAAVEDGGVRLTLEGFKGRLEPGWFQLWTDDAGIDLTLATRDPSTLHWVPKRGGTIGAGAPVLVGELRLHPDSSCRPARRRCEVTVSYPLRLEVRQ